MKKRRTNRRVLIVCEGRETEYNYFVGFRDVFEQELKVAETRIDVARGKGGNAKAIVEHAINKATAYDPDRQNGDRVFLVMDTEGVGRAPELPAAEQMARKHGIEIVYSSPAIEYWLLCHFAKAPRRRFRDGDAVIVELNKKWKAVCKADYDKANPDLFERLSASFDTALEQALEIDLHHLRTESAARGVNPSSQVYELIAILIGVQSGKKCPLAGAWEPIAGVDDESTQQRSKFNKGEKLPDASAAIARWMHCSEAS